MLLLGVVAIVLAGCGGSSSADRAKLMKKLGAQLVSADPIVHPLEACFVRRARSLSVVQLRAVANAGLNPPPSEFQIALRLFTECLQQGNELPQMHRLVNQRMTIPGAEPAAFADCLDQQLNATTARELSRVIAVDLYQGIPRDQNGLGKETIQCVRRPSVLSAWRAWYVAHVRQLAPSLHADARYTNCLLAKIDALSDAQLKEAVLNPSSDEIGPLGVNDVDDCAAY